LDSPEGNRDLNFFVNSRLLALVMLLGCGGLLRAQNGTAPLLNPDDAGKPAPQLQDKDKEQIEDDDTSPYHLALLAYKAGDYEKARQELSKSDPAQLDDRAVILGSRVLVELKRYDEAEKILRSRLQSGDVLAIQTALGDVLLFRHHFSDAAKYYSAARETAPNDPDLKLKQIYADVGAGSMVEAGQLASELTPLDPKHPYDDHASYYFAQAALAESAGREQDAQDQIQIARTNYGITVTDRYLKTYLKVFTPASTPETGAGQKPPAPSGVK
jgi:predicted Zn-dependent protease